MKKNLFFIAGLVLLVGGSLATVSYGQKPKIIKAKPAPAAKPAAGKAAPGKPDATAESVEPDKVLYDKALDFLKHGHYTEARLNFQTLINTYPDSEYLAKAKLGTADSFYKEGGTSNMVQAIAEYKDFITFFPFLDEAPYAQMQVGMGHYRMMEKSDRDSTQAQQAEQEFQTFMLKYPQSPLMPKAEQYLRDVQEVLADGEFKIGRYYYLRARSYPVAYPAATARLMEVSERYPLYSQADQALWMLADVYMRAKQFSKNEDDKNHWADLAGQCYDQIVKNYPLSKWAPNAKSQLTSIGMPVPPADPDAVQRMKQQQIYAQTHHSTRASLLGLPMGMIKSNPNVSLAARSGTPTLSAPDNVVSATDVLKTGAAGPNFTVSASMPAADAGAGGAATDSSTPWRPCRHPERVRLLPGSALKSFLRPLQTLPLPRTRPPRPRRRLPPPRRAPPTLRQLLLLPRAVPLRLAASPGPQLTRPHKGPKRRVDRTSRPQLRKQPRKTTQARNPPARRKRA